MITDKGQMKQWYFEVSDFKAEVGSEFQFVGESDGKKYHWYCFDLGYLIFGSGFN